MSSKIYYSKLLLGIILTIFAMLLKDVLPKKVVSLVPNSDPAALYFLNGADPAKAYWIDKEKFQYQCKNENFGNISDCSFTFILGKDGINGINLQDFTSLNLDVTYGGSAKSMQMSIRNYDPRFSTPTDSNSAKFNFLILDTRELNKPLNIGLNEFRVADWWIFERNIPRSQTQPDFQNSITLSLDVDSSIYKGEHNIHIKKIEFSGDRISAENWYLMIILIWVVFGTWYGMSRLINLLRDEKRHREKISDLVKTNSNLRTETDKFRKLSTVDALTNAFNRHGIEEILAQGDIRKAPASIIMIDVDHFKRINDRRGHDFGDTVLQKMCEVIHNNTRTNDKLGRWGGEEFILLCPSTSVEMAAVLAEKLRRAIADIVIDESNPITFTASFGVTEFLADEPFSAAFKRADVSLYNAKMRGRNCVVVAELEQSV